MLQTIAAAAFVTAALSAGAPEAKALRAQDQSTASQVSPAKFAVASESIRVNGQNMTVSMLKAGNGKLIALGDLAKMYGAAATSAKGLITVKAKQKRAYPAAAIGFQDLQA